VDLPLGHTAGPPNDPVLQRKIVQDALELAVAMEKPQPGEPGPIADIGVKWSQDSWKASPMSWSRGQEAAGASGAEHADTRSDRSDQPQWQSPEDQELFNQN